MKKNVASDDEKEKLDAVVINAELDAYDLMTRNSSSASRKRIFNALAKAFGFSEEELDKDMK